MAKAEPANTTEATEAAPRPKTGILYWVSLAVVGLVACVAGFALPQILAGGKLGLGRPGDSSRPRADGEGASEVGSVRSAGRDSGIAQSAFVRFGDVVVNVNDVNLTRYLRVTITLVVDSSHEEEFKRLVEKRKTILKNWLIGYLSDKSLDELRGAAGVNRARREIQDQFNSLLYPDGSERIRDVLFEEFTVQ